jgi:hypothetical protein
MKYVAIMKTSQFSEHPTGFPVEVREYDSSDEAAKNHPEARIMTGDQYAGFKEAMNVAMHHSLNAAKHKAHADYLRSRGWWHRLTRKGEK